FGIFPNPFFAQEQSFLSLAGFVVHIIFFTFYAFLKSLHITPWTFLTSNPWSLAISCLASVTCVSWQRSHVSLERKACKMRIHFGETSLLSLGVGVETNPTLII
ncbi:hypothetical protein ACJX0J_012813, partial [Zea mays]